MSICANIFVLFKEDAMPAEAHVVEMQEAISNRIGIPVVPKTEQYGRLKAFEDADSLVEISESGTIEFYDNWRPVSSAASRLKGRLFYISYLTRWWDKIYPEGPVVTYALTMLWLMSQADVVDVWYMSDDYSDGGRYQRMSKTQAHEMIDAFVALGDMTSR